MLEAASNKELLDAWEAGNEAAAHVLVHRYMARLLALARSRLSRKLARRIDPEDIVLSAWRSFFVASQRGLVAHPDDDLWPLLVTLTMRKLARQGVRQRALRRDGSRDLSLDSLTDWTALAHRDPSPAEAAELADEVEQLLGALEEFDQEVFRRRLQGWDQRQIASELQCSDRTVRRSLERIRSTITARGLLTSPKPARPVKSAISRVAELAVMSPAPLTPTVLYSQVLLQQHVGQGGFAKVFRGQMLQSGEPVAVKFLRKRFWNNDLAAQHLLTDLTRLSELRHPGIVRPHGWGWAPQQALFTVMEWIEGDDLRRWHPSGLMLSELLECGIAVAAALEAAHSLRIIHGDLTPGNVLRRKSGAFLLTDFGFSQTVSEKHPIRGGTPGFLAPEQVSDAFGPVTTQTDVYGLGGLLFYLITGHPPFHGSDVPEVLAQVLSSVPVSSEAISVPGIPATVADLLTCCLSKEPAARPQTIAEVRRALLAIAQG